MRRRQRLTREDESQRQSEGRQQEHGGERHRPPATSRAPQSTHPKQTPAQTCITERTHTHTHTHTHTRTHEHRWVFIAPKVNFIITTFLLYLLIKCILFPFQLRLIDFLLTFPIMQLGTSHVFHFLKLTFMHLVSKHKLSSP